MTAKKIRTLASPGAQRGLKRGGKMGCNHKKRVRIITAMQKRPRKSMSFIKETFIDVWWCPTCDYVRFDSRNDYIYQKGVWMEAAHRIVLDKDAT